MRSQVTTLCVVALAAACSKPAEKPAATADTAMAPPAAAVPAGADAAAPTAALVVLYQMPKDTAKFESYYSATHLPLVSTNAKAIGFTRSVFEKFEKGPDGKAPKYYRKAELWFDSMDALQKGTSSPEFKAVADDIPKFATGGVVVMVARETK